MEREKQLGDLALVLTGEEVGALERAIWECSTNTGSSDKTILKSVEQKLKDAKEKML